VTLLRLLSIAAAPLILFAIRLSKDALAQDKLMVDGDTITIHSTKLLRAPITLARRDVAAVMVDDQSAINAYERLRFTVDDGQGFIYSSVKGSALPLLSNEPAVPNIAVVLTRPRRFSQLRRRLAADSFAPLRRLTRADTVPGLLLEVVNPDEARHVLAGWQDVDAARAALNGWQASVVEQLEERRGIQGIEFSASHQPMDTAELDRPIWPSRTLIALVFIFVVQGRKGVYTSASSVALAAGFAAILVAGVLDRRRRYEERRGTARIAPLAVLGMGVFITLGAMTAATLHG
jgi:hypothetical protein